MFKSVQNRVEKNTKINQVNMSGKRLLYIEDNEDHQNLVKFTLEMYTDWEILLASDGIEGITLAQTKQPDAILLDIVMPKPDGFTVCESLNYNSSTSVIPIIFITVMTQAKKFSNFKNTSVKGIITKPFDPFNLHFQIAHICNWSLIN